MKEVARFFCTYLIKRKKKRNKNNDIPKKKFEANYSFLLFSCLIHKYFSMKVKSQSTVFATLSRILGYRSYRNYVSVARIGCPYQPISRNEIGGVD